MSGVRVLYGYRLPCKLVGNTCLFSNGVTASLSDEERKLLESIPTHLGRFILLNKHADFYRQLINAGLLRLFPENMVISSIILKVTIGCNLTCNYCYQWSSPDAINKKMSVQTAINAIEKLSFGDQPFIQFHGGEPLLMFDDLIVPIVKRYAGRAVFTIQTNGVLLSSRSFAERVYNFFVRTVGSLDIGVSIDGLEKDNFMRILPNGENSWPYVVQGIKNLVELGADIGTLVTVNKRSVTHLPKVAEFLYNLGVRSMKANMLYPAGHPEVVKLAPDPNDYVDGLIALAKWRLKLYEKEPEAYFKITTLAEYTTNLLGGVISACMHSPCGMGARFFSVDYNGDVYPCDHAPEWLNLGNVNDENFDVYNPTNISKLLKIRSLAGKRGTEGPCSDCPFRAYCHNGGCPLFLHQMYDDEFWKHRYFCPRRLFEFLLKILDEGDICKVTVLTEGVARC